MATIIELGDLQASSHDLDELDSLLRRLVGKPFLFFRGSYGDELTIHLGSPSRYDHPKLKHREKGTYLIGTMASAWVLEPGTPPLRIFASDDCKVLSGNVRARQIELSAIETEKSIVRGSLVTEATSMMSRHGLTLSLSFLDGSQIVLIPVPMSDGPDDEGESPLVLPNWEIFMPDHRLLRGWPDGSWSYTDSRDKPGPKNHMAGDES